MPLSTTWMLIALHTARGARPPPPRANGTPGLRLARQRGRAQAMRTSSDIGSYAGRHGVAARGESGRGLDLGQEPALHRRRPRGGLRVPQRSTAAADVFLTNGAGRAKVAERAGAETGQGLLLRRRGAREDGRLGVPARHRGPKGRLDGIKSAGVEDPRDGREVRRLRPADGRDREQRRHEGRREDRRTPRSSPRSRPAARRRRGAPSSRRRRPRGRRTCSYS